MIHRKKILSLLLAASMLLTAAPAAYAADNPENPQPVDEITAELPEELPDYADGGIRPHIHNRDPLRPEYNTSNRDQHPCWRKKMRDLTALHGTFSHGI